MYSKKAGIIFCSFLLAAVIATAQQKNNDYWHGIERTLRYRPDGEDFVITNGTRKFTRALYGTNTAFRVETSDVPEFALYLPGMGGNIKLGIIRNNTGKWLSGAANIVARYRSGSRIYEIQDPLLENGKIIITTLALADAEGVIIKIEAAGIPADTRLVWTYGAVTGKKFSRDGDMGPDPESVFYMKPEYCKGNTFSMDANSFLLSYGGAKPQYILGMASAGSVLKINDAQAQASPLSLWQSNADSTPVITGNNPLLNNQAAYLLIAKQDSSAVTDKNLAGAFDKAEKARQRIAGRIKVATPDAYINTIGAAVSIAADAIWEEPSYMHGAIGWRMRLNGWRGAYAADVLGWHDRARMHFNAYAKSQLTTPPTRPVIADTALNLARQLEKLGTSLFSEGYICRNPNGDFRPHHYDMNLVFIDQLLWHFNWTGDTAYVKEMWPLLTRHLAWEKRNFDADNDGLYDAYAAIWASDALQYSGGAVTHSSAYNYRANKMAAMLARIIGEDGSLYEGEAKKILAAINNTLWLKEKGHYAEFKDAMGLQLLHEDAALWTIYHSLDSDIDDPLQAYQSIQYINNQIPHIPVKAKGLSGDYYTLSTTDWMPYTWSLNNVALAELMHTSLAFWQSGRNEEAFRLWKSSLIESMYLGGSPGNFQQISTYDAARGEAYRDFADPVGMAARSLVQGLFGILPDALNNRLLIRPGFPAAWKNASLETPDIRFDFKRNGSRDEYTITAAFHKNIALQLQLKANGSNIKGILVNGRNTAWQDMTDAVGVPMIQLNAGKAASYKIIIEWLGKAPVENNKLENAITSGKFVYSLPGATIKEVFDPQQLFVVKKITGNQLNARLSPDTGYKTAFIRLQQGSFTFWKPVNLLLKQPLELVYDTRQKKNSIAFRIKNNSNADINAAFCINYDTASFIRVPVKAGAVSAIIVIPEKEVLPGSNHISLRWNGNQYSTNICNWNVDRLSDLQEDKISLQHYFNDQLINIFRNRYLSPRPSVPTLQLPVQGIGDWTHPRLTAIINDSGFRSALLYNSFRLPQKISFMSVADPAGKNILFTSQWDNFPSKQTIPLDGKAAHAYFLMAGSTNPMQSQLVNGKIIVQYSDGSSDSLLLRNPQNWWPIEQDYLDDGYAFNTKAVRPVRIHLKTGKVFSDLNDPGNINNGQMIDGGAATVLDMPLDKNKTLRSLSLQAEANDVIIGLMGITLLR
ncbi:MAG: DUF4450 domain-containing protein [Ferruginibacter sp.]